VCALAGMRRAFGMFAGVPEEWSWQW